MLSPQAKDFIGNPFGSDFNVNMNEVDETYMSTKPTSVTPHIVRYDPVAKPKHYNQDNNIECIDAIEACIGKNFPSYLQGNVLKYLWRYEYKGKPVEDLEKAKWYLEKLIFVLKDTKLKNDLEGVE